MISFLYRLFLPHRDNNYRSCLLHHRNLLIAIIVLFFGSFLVSSVKTAFPSVLGISTDISSERLLLLTNKVRQENGLSSLILNSQLSEAAAKKGEDMFAKNYWAHNSPDGTTPWVFITNSGYNYVYAGENLARGFNNTNDVISAWMASSTHKANILSQNYKDVGFAVEVGKLNNEETVLVVEEFGNQNIAEKIPTGIAFNKIQSGIKGSNVVSASPIGNSMNKKSFLGSLPFVSGVNTIVISMFILALVLDMIVVGRKRIARLAGHNIDHILFLAMILLIIYIITKGSII